MVNMVDKMDTVDRVDKREVVNTDENVAKFNILTL